MVADIFQLKEYGSPDADGSAHVLRYGRMGRRRQFPGIHSDVARHDGCDDAAIELPDLIAPPDRVQEKDSRSSRRNIPVWVGLFPRLDSNRNLLLFSVRSDRRPSRPHSRFGIDNSEGGGFCARVVGAVSVQLVEARMPEALSESPALRYGALA